MRITQKQLRQIIKEELLREAGFGDLRVAEHDADLKATYDTLEAAWYNALDSDIEGNEEGGRLIANAQAKVPVGKIVSSLVTRHKLPDFHAMKPKLMSNFDKSFSSLKGVIDDKLLDIEIRGEYEKWVDHVIWLASIMFVTSYGEYEYHTDRWNGLRNTASWLGQEIRKKNIPVGSEDQIKKGVIDMFMRGTEEMTGVVKQLLADGL